MEDLTTQSTVPRRLPHRTGFHYALLYQRHLGVYR